MHDVYLSACVTPNPKCDWGAGQVGVDSSGNVHALQGAGTAG